MCPGCGCQAAVGTRWACVDGRNFGLLLGDDTAATTVKDVMAAVATSHAKPAALPRQNAPPVCRATIKLVADATRGWHRTTHWLYHTTVRHAVFAVLVVAERLQTKDALPAEAPADL